MARILVADSCQLVCSRLRSVVDAHANWPVVAPYLPGLRLLVLLLAAALVGLSPCAGHSQEQTLDRVLVIGTKEAPPFAIKRQDGSWNGISIELWRRIADHAHLRYRLIEAATVQELLDGVANGSFDVAVAAVTATAARARSVEFTQPFYNTGLGIAVPISESGWRSIERALLSFGFVQAVAALVGIALLVGLIIWLLERRSTEHFGGGAKGLGSSFWWSTTAMTQKGASQNAPQTLPGRLVAIAWMIASVIAVAVFTAGITSTLTRRELQGAVHSFADLHSVRVGAVENSATTEYLAHQQVPFRSFPDPQAGLTALDRGAIDAFVYDRPLLTWLVHQNFATSLRVLDTSFGNESYAMVLPKGSGLRPLLDLAVLDETESDWWQQTLFAALGVSRSP